jgi:hypothetical protein
MVKKLDGYDSILDKLNAHDTSLADIAIQPKGAKGDGTVDDTVAIQNALNTVPSNVYAKGVRVLLPSGHFKITSLTIPNGVTLEGQYAFDPINRTGTWFYCVDQVNPAIKLNTGTAVKNIAFFYPEQAWNSTAGTPLYAYPATLKVLLDAKRILIRDVLLQNSYIGIDADRHHEFLVLDNVQGYAIYKGVIVDFTTDIDRFKTVHFNANAWSVLNPPNMTEIAMWTRRNGIAFTVRRADWIVLFDIFGWGYRKGLRLEDSPATKTDMADVIPTGEPKMPSGVHLTNSGFDACGICVEMASGYGIEVTDCFFTAFNSFEDNGTYTNNAIEVLGGQDITIKGCRWWGTSYGCLTLACENSIVTNNSFWEYGLRAVSDSQDIRAVSLYSGTHMIVNNVFNGKTGDRTYGVIINSSSSVTNIKDNTFRDFKTACINAIATANNFIIGQNIYKGFTGTNRVWFDGTPSNYKYTATNDLIVP